MTGKVIKIFHREVSVQNAQELLQLHHKAFSQSSCRSCSGLCCSDCAEEEAYLHRDAVSDWDVQKLKKKYGFDRKAGFKGPQGCNLPLHLRSTTCVAFYCENEYNQNSFARNTAAKMRQQHPGPSIPANLVSFQVEALHIKMRELF